MVGSRDEMRPSRVMKDWPCAKELCNGLFTLPDSDSDSDPNPNGYIALYRSFNTERSQIQIPILTANSRNGIKVLDIGVNDFGDLGQIDS